MGSSGSFFPFLAFLGAAAAAKCLDGRVVVEEDMVGVDDEREVDVAIMPMRLVLADEPMARRR